MTLFTVDGREVDVAINGVGFMLATEQELPQTIETQQVRKDQFDAEPDPGEQSLAGYWRRSQASFHEGAGNLYQESSENVASNGFFDSRGVDVFSVKGRFSLLKTMTSQATTASGLGRLRAYASALTRTNRCTNPSVETNTTGWSVTGAGTGAASSAQAYVGTQSYLVSVNSNSQWIAHLPAVTTVAGTVYTLSAYVKSTNATYQVRMSNGAGGADAATGAAVNLSNNWTRLSVTFTAATTSYSPRISSNGLEANGNLVYIDAVLYEAAPAPPGSYFDGAQGGAAWTGTAHASTSTMTVSDGQFFLSAVGTARLFTNSSGTFTAAHSPAGKTIVDGLVAGATFYDVASDGTLYQGDLSSPGTATTWPCGTTPSRLGWGKHRLWIIGGRKLWQPDLSLAGGTAQNPIFTHPNLGWNYTCMAEGPAAMYFGGHDGLTSSIQAITFTDGGGVPTLTGASVTAVLPDGELVKEIVTLAGQFIGIGTTRGFRVGRIETNNGITYGPLLFEGSVTALSTLDRFFVVGTDGSPIIKKVDTATELSEGVFAYANDVEAVVSGTISSAANNIGTLAFTLSSGDVYVQSQTYMTSGYVQSGRIRFRTTEDKSFKYVNVECEPLPSGATVVTDLIVQAGTTVAAGTISTVDQQEGVFTITQSPMRFLSVKITLNKGTSNTPAVNSYLLRALPASTPHRIITLPLLCFDKEKGRSGQMYGKRGYANSRLLQLQALEDDATTVPYQNFADTDDGSTNVVVDSIRFVQTSPPRANQSRGDGGILILTLRTVPV